VVVREVQYVQVSEVSNLGRQRLELISTDV